jgi:hypothetical protein
MMNSLDEQTIEQLTEAVGQVEGAIDGIINQLGEDDVQEGHELEVPLAEDPHEGEEESITSPTASIQSYLFGPSSISPASE